MRFSDRRAQYPELFSAPLAARASQATKFGALTAAFASAGAFIYVRADRAYDEPVVIRCTAPSGSGHFPLERRARRARGASDRPRAHRGHAGRLRLRRDGNHRRRERGRHVCGGATSRRPRHRLSPIVSARPGRDSKIAWALAELGGRWLPAISQSPSGLPELAQRLPPSFSPARRNTWTRSAPSNTTPATRPRKH